MLTVTVLKWLMVWKTKKKIRTFISKKLKLVLSKVNSLLREGN